MTRTIYTLLAAIAIAVTGCTNRQVTEHCTFPEEPTIRDISISLINYADYKDLLVNGKYEIDSIRVIQPCSPGTPITVRSGSATRTDSNIVVNAVSFDGISTFSNWRDCNKLAVWWSNNDLDTVQFVMEKVRCAGKCCISYYPRIIVDGVTFNPDNAVTGDDGKLHFLLVKAIP